MNVNLCFVLLVQFVGSGLAMICRCYNHTNNSGGIQTLEKQQQKGTESTLNSLALILYVA